MWQADNARITCSVGPTEACADCRLGTDLTCSFSRRDLLPLIATFLVFCAPAIAGVVRSGHRRQNARRTDISYLRPFVERLLCQMKPI
jgi:hypothetical protein